MLLLAACLAAALVSPVVGAPADARARALALLQRGQYAEAAQALAPLAATHPRDADLQYRLGVARQRSGDLPGAINAFNRAARLRPNEAVYAAALARLYAELPRADRASFWYRKLLRLRPKNPKLAEEAASFVLQQGNPLEAELILKQATAANPKAPELWLLLAQCYQQMKLDAEQARCLEQAARLQPAQPDQLRKLIDLYLQAGQPDRALPYLQLAVRRQPQSAALQARLAECYLAVDDRRAAVAAYRAAARLAPRVAQYQLALAQALGDDDPAEALRAYDAAFALQQPLADQLLTVSALAAKAGRPEAALGYLTWLVALTPGELEPRRMLIQAAQAEHDTPTALMQWRELQRAGQQQYALEEAELALRLGGREWALTRLQEVADRSAGDAVLQARLASLFQQLHDAPRAEMLARAALARSGGGAAEDVRATRLLAAQVLLQVEQPEAAEPVFQEVLQAAPDNAVARRGLALCALQRGQVRAAWEQLRRAVPDHPRDVETIQAFIEAAEAADEMDATALVFQALLCEAPDNAAVLDGLTMLYRRQGGTALAARRLGDLADRQPRQGLLNLAAARELAAAGRRQEAAAIYERLARGSEFTAAARVGLCHVLLAQQRYSELIAALARLTGPQAIGAEPYRLLLAARSDLALQTGADLNLAAVAQAAADVALADPESEAYYLALAEMYLATRQVDAGVTFLQTEATRRAVAVPATVGLTRLLRQLGRPREALVWLNQTEGAAGSPTGLLERAQCLLQVQRVPEAGLAAEQVLQMTAGPTAYGGASLAGDTEGNEPGVRAEAHMVAAEACAQGYRPEEALWHLVQAITNGGPRERLTYRIVGLCINQPLSETAVLNALQQLYAAGFTEAALGIADALVAKPGFGRLKQWAMQRARRDQ